MADSTNIDQKAGFGAQGNTFIGEQHNHSGLTPADATQMAFAIFREYYPQLRQEALDALNKMLEQKLNEISPENIISPKPRIVVPTLQNASLTEEQEIRELYAELLAKSMNRVMEDNVHPGFVEVIKQICPDEAKILGYFSKQNVVPTVTLKLTRKDRSGTSIIKNFSNVGELTDCDKPFKISEYFDNLIRLGLLRTSPAFVHLADEKRYEPLKKHPFFKDILNFDAIFMVGYNGTTFDEGFIELTDYGKAFCNICISPNRVKPK